MKKLSIEMKKIKWVLTKLHIIPCDHSFGVYKGSLRSERCKCCSKLIAYFNAKGEKKFVA